MSKNGVNRTEDVEQGRGAGEGEGSGAGERSWEGSRQRGRGEEQGTTLGTSSFQAGGEEGVRRGRASGGEELDLRGNQMPAAGASSALSVTP